MAFSADDRLRELSKQEACTLERLESSRQELVELREQIRVARKTLRRQQSHLAAEQYQHDCIVKQTELDLAKRSNRLVRLWRLFKKRIRTERTELRSQVAHDSSTLDHRARLLDEKRARLEMREVLLRRAQQRLARRSRRLIQQARRIKSTTEATQHSERHIEELRTEIAGLELRAEHLRENQIQPVSREPERPEITVVCAPDADFGDLRQRMLESWSDLLTACSTWSEQQHGAAQMLAQIEQQLIDKAGTLAQTMTDVTTRQWALERAEDALVAREQRLAQRTATLAQTYETWAMRLRSEHSALTAERQEAAAARYRWVELQNVEIRLRSELHNRECAVAARELAVERLRQEVIDAADAPTALARRLERLHRRWWATLNSDERELTQRQERIEQLMGDMDRREQNVTARESLAEQCIAQRMEQLAILERHILHGDSCALPMERSESEARTSPARAA